MNRFKFLKEKLNFEPFCILDIGANAGDWTTETCRVFPDAQYILIEANVNWSQHLHNRFHYDKRKEIHMCLLGDSNKPNVSFYINSKNNKCTGCSIMKETTIHYKDAIEVKIPMKKLDDLMGDRHAEIIKIDVQGAECLVLQGGLETMKHAEFIILETSTLEYNQGAPTMLEVLNFMNEHNFQVYDLIEIHHSDELMIQLDFMFIRKDSQYMPSFTADGVQYKHKLKK